MADGHTNMIPLVSFLLAGKAFKFQFNKAFSRPVSVAALSGLSFLWRP